MTDVTYSSRVTELSSSLFPERVTIEFTNHCNLNCVMCPRQYMNGPKGYMHPLLYKKIIDEIAGHEGVAIVPFFRGESLLHPDCIDMLAYAKQKGIRPIQFTTNATLLDEDTAKKMIDLELDFISFSVDSIDPETYEKIRKGADLNKVLKNIETFCDLKKGYNKPEIQVSIVKSADSSKGLHDFINYWTGKIDRIRVYEEHSKDGNFGSLMPDGYILNAADRKPCLKPFKEMVIYWNGNIAICNHDWSRSTPLGNLNKDSIENIWYSEGYEKIRRGHRGKEELEQVCKNCDHWKMYYNEAGFIGKLFSHQ